MSDDDDEEGGGNADDLVAAYDPMVESFASVDAMRTASTTSINGHITSTMSSNASKQFKQFNRPITPNHEIDIDTAIDQYRLPLRLICWFIAIIFLTYTGILIMLPLYHIETDYTQLITFHRDEGDDYRMHNIGNPPHILDSLLIHHRRLPPFPRLPAICIPRWGGRFGNQIYELMFIITQAIRFNLTLYLDGDWPGLQLMLISTLYPLEPCPTKMINHSEIVDIPTAYIEEPWPNTQWGDWSDLHPNYDGRLGLDNISYVVKYQGFFQLPTYRYIPYRQILYEQMQPKPWLDHILTQLWYQVLQSIPSHTLLIGIHVRHGDFNDHTVFKRIPLEWYYQLVQQMIHDNANTQTGETGILSNALQEQNNYRDQLQQTLQQLKLNNRGSTTTTTTSTTTRLCQPDTTHTTSATPDHPAVCFLLVSDDLVAVANAFRNHHFTVITSGDILSLADSAVMRLSADAREFYLHWWLLTQPAIVATSHSTFSISACLFNHYQQQGRYYRPDPNTKTLVLFDPWNYYYNYLEFKDVKFQTENTNIEGGEKTAT